MVVIGGGPAGSALATFLSRRGYRCCLFEQAKFPRYHIGESLIPNTYPVFEELGILPKLKKSAFPRKHSVRFVSSTGGESRPFYFSERIPGESAVTWQVERGEFDRMMLDHAQSNGVIVEGSMHVERVLFQGDRAKGVMVKQRESAPFNVRARVVVDASGRATLLGNQLGLKRPVPGLEKSSVWGYYKHGARLPGIDAGETTIFRTHKDGWFWYIPLPDDIVSVGLVDETDAVFEGLRDPKQRLLDAVQECRPLADRLREAVLTEPVRGLKHLAYFNTRTCGPGWVMIGDARAFLDPIYSSGLFLALGSAEAAAQCIHEALEADDVSAARLGQFEPALGEGIDAIHHLIKAFYDPAFSFVEFARRFPDQQAALVDCLIGDVIKDMSGFKRALGQMTPPPPTLQELKACNGRCRLDITAFPRETTCEGIES